MSQSMNTRLPSADVTNLLVKDGVAISLTQVTMESQGWKERGDLQRWVRGQSHLIETGLLLITEELDEWESRATPVLDRLDLLFLDQEGRPLVVELKRGMAPDRTEAQALQYAAYCDQLKTSDLVDHYSRTHKVDADTAKAAIEAHAPILVEEQPGRVRVRIVAEQFPPSVTATVLFLRDIAGVGAEGTQFDIGCIRLTVNELPDSSHVVTSQRIIPLPEIEEYLVRRRRRQSEDESTRAERSRSAHAVPLLQEAGIIAVGETLTLYLDGYRGEARNKLDALLAVEPKWGELTWTGERNSRRAVQQHDSDEPLSLDAAHQKVLAAAGLPGASGATHCWHVGTTKETVRRTADRLSGE